MNLTDQLRRDEGESLHAYPDPMTKAEPYTIGVGHTGADVHPWTVWTQRQCDEQLALDIKSHTADLLAHLPWVNTLSTPRLGALQNMCFNLGINRLLEFTHFLTALKFSDWNTAAHEMLNSEWARQVGARADRLAEQVRVDVWQ